jgi:hypothetical protein
LKQLYARYGNRVHFVDVFIRQAHPSERHGAYRSYQEKRTEAQTYQREEDLPWLVLVDDLAGTTHQTYGDLPDPVYLIDAHGHVVFYGMWTHVPTLQRELAALVTSGEPGGHHSQGIDRMIHMFASFVGGWRSVRRGGIRAVLEYELGTPPAATLTFLGHLAAPGLAPLALRATPLPAAVRLAGAGSVAVAAALVVWGYHARA